MSRSLFAGCAPLALGLALLPGAAAAAGLPTLSIGVQEAATPAEVSTTLAPRALLISMDSARWPLISASELYSSWPSSTWATSSSRIGAPF